MRYSPAPLTSATCRSDQLPVVARTANASLRMRGINPQGTAKVALEYPVNTRVTTLQPTLRWSGSRSPW